MPKFTREEVERVVAALEAIARDRTILTEIDRDQREALLRAAGYVSRPTREEGRRLRKAFRALDREKEQSHDRGLRAATQIRVVRSGEVFVAPARVVPALAPPGGPSGDDGASDARELHAPRACYVCKTPFRKVHFFYDSMCPGCAELNYQKRFQTAPLDGRIALLTGARIKIGYQAALMLLRAGAHVIVTTRFPRDAAARYAREEDFARWKDRLEIHGLDLRHSPSVEVFARYLTRNKPHLDLLINNAAQTVRRPPGSTRTCSSSSGARRPRSLPSCGGCSRPTRPASRPSTRSTGGSTEEGPSSPSRGSRRGSSPGAATGRPSGSARPRSSHGSRARSTTRRASATCSRRGDATPTSSRSISAR